MKKKLINSQISNFKTYLMYLRQMESLAKNVFIIDNIPEEYEFLDFSLIENTLLRQGSIAWFVDEVMGLLALPYTSLSGIDINGKPLRIEVYAQNGYHRILNRNEFVIMYDNNGRYPLFLDIKQYAERVSLCQRTIDINVYQQRTPRAWKTTVEQERTLRDTISNIDGFEETILTYDDVDLNDSQMVLAPAPFVADKVDEQKERIWNEFLRLIGISNLSIQKKERNIRDEISAMQGGTIASRFSRFDARKKAIQEINKKFGLDLKVKYYDGEPTSEIKPENDEGVDEDDVSTTNNETTNDL